MSKLNLKQRAHGLWSETRRLVIVIYNEMDSSRAYTVAAALAFYFFMALIPLLLLVSALIKALPIPNLFQSLLNLMAQLVPSYAWGFVEQIVIGILGPSSLKLFSFGIIGYLWAASGGFSSLIEALDIAYDVKHSRSWWRDRLRGLILIFTSGGLASVSLLAYIVGPRFGHFLSQYFLLPPGVEPLWTILRPIIVFVTFVAGLEIIYYLGPNLRHSFVSTLPGAILAIAAWFLGSRVLSYYLSHLSNFNATYGSLGALIGLMLWFYLTALAILLGAELNAELLKTRKSAAHPSPL
jgi:membrane protein